MKDDYSIQELREIFNRLSRGTSGRLIIERNEENRMREIIESLFSDELSREQ